MRRFLARSSRATWVTVISAACLVAGPLGATSPAAATHGSGGSTGDPAEIANWNAIAVSTLVGDTSKQGPETFLYMGFVQAAVYNAVVGVEGGYKPYDFHARAPHGTSSQAAAVAAAHKVLVTYSPYATATLDAAYATSLLAIPDGWAKDAGVQFGTLAADTLIQQRANDGRNAPVFFTTPPAPGVWRPTPPPLLPMADPWLGGVTPLLVHSAVQFGPPGPPPALTSWRYTRDFNEVKDIGGAVSTMRTDAQTATARFFSGNAMVQYNAALRDQVAVRRWTSSTLRGCLAQST